MTIIHKLFGNPENIDEFFDKLDNRDHKMIFYRGEITSRSYFVRDFIRGEGFVKADGEREYLVYKIEFEDVNRSYAKPRVRAALDKFMNELKSETEKRGLVFYDRTDPKKQCKYYIPNKPENKNGENSSDREIESAKIETQKIKIINPWDIEVDKIESLVLGEGK